MQNKRKVNINVRLTQQEKNQLKTSSETNKVTPSQMVRFALKYVNAI